jgi:hypothetical protein
MDFQQLRNNIDQTIFNTITLPLLQQLQKQIKGQLYYQFLTKEERIKQGYGLVPVKVIHWKWVKSKEEVLTAT